MRKALFLAVLLAACAKGETPPTDTAAAMTPPPPPVKLTAADLAGSWTGTSKAAGTDSVTSKWVATSTSDSTGTATYEGTKTTVAYTTTFDADSVMVASAAFVPPGAKASAPKIMFKSVGRIQDGKLVGTAVTHLAAKPDSVLGRTTFEATRSQ